LSVSAGRFGVTLLSAPLSPIFIVNDCQQDNDAYSGSNFGKDALYLKEVVKKNTYYI
jgi:hypothetical protein